MDAISFLGHFGQIASNELSSGLSKIHDPPIKADVLFICIKSIFDNYMFQKRLRNVKS